MLLKVKADSAEVVWKSKAKGERPNQTTDLSSIMPTPVIDGDHIYGVCSYGQLRCIEVEHRQAGLGDDEGDPRQAHAAEGRRRATNPDGGERWSNAFIIPHGDRYFLFNEQGDLIIAKLTPKGYEEIEPRTSDRPDEQGRPRPPRGLDPPGVREQVRLRAERQGIGLLRFGEMTWRVDYDRIGTVWVLCNSTLACCTFSSCRWVVTATFTRSWESDEP